MHLGNFSSRFDRVELFLIRVMRNTCIGIKRVELCYMVSKCYVEHIYERTFVNKQPIFRDRYERSFVFVSLYGMCIYERAFVNTGV